MAVYIVIDAKNRVFQFFNTIRRTPAAARQHPAEGVQMASSSRIEVSALLTLVQRLPQSVAAVE